jgi:chromosome segregation ATPase
MSNMQEYLKQTMASLRQQRDELALQIHLGKAEAQEEWEKVQAKLEALSKEYEPLRDAVEQSAENVGDSFKLVASEIMAGFQRIRKSLSS